MKHPIAYSLYVLGPVYLFGAGNIGKAFALLCKQLCLPMNLVGFLDNNAKLYGTTVHGYPVWHPTYPKLAGEKPYVIIASNVNANELENECQKLGYQSIRLPEFIRTQIEPFCHKKFKPFMGRILAPESEGKSLPESEDDTWPIQTGMEYLPKENIIAGLTDSTGQVGLPFVSADRHFFAVKPESIPFCKTLLDSGVLDELQTRGLIARTKQSEYYSKQYKCILEIESFNTTPRQYWTQSMLRDVIFCAVHIQKILARFGFMLRDLKPDYFAVANGKAVLYNINAIAVDDGSYRMFFDYLIGDFIVPYYTWTFGDYYLFRQLLQQCNHSLLPNQASFHSTEGCNQYLHKILNDLPSDKRKILCDICDQKLPDQAELDTLLDEHNIQTEWSAYYGEQPEFGSVKAADRFVRTLQLVAQYAPDAKTATDLAGNMGIFSELLLTHANMEKVVCIDYDEQAINQGYRRARNCRQNIVFCPYDFTQSACLHFARADVTVTLAAMHHLILIQKLDIDYLMMKIAQYTKHIALVEFMPFGTWWGQDPSKSAPSWYTEEWFQKHFEKYFNFLYKEHYFTNRIVFVGNVK